MKTFAKMIVAAIVALGMACVLIWHDASDRAVISVYFFGAIGISAVLGVFDVNERKERTMHTRIKDAARYRKAA